MILGKISKFDATRCQILRLKCTKFDFRWDWAQTLLGKLTALPQTSWLYLRGLLLILEGGLRGRGTEGEVREKGKEGKGEEKGKGREWEGERRGEGICRTNIKLVPTRLRRTIRSLMAHEMN